MLHLSLHAYIGKEREPQRDAVRRAPLTSAVARAGRALALG